MIPISRYPAKVNDRKFLWIKKADEGLMLTHKLACFSLVVLGGMSVGAEVKTSAERKNDVLGAHSLTLPAPINRWDNALPLGNDDSGTTMP